MAGGPPSFLRLLGEAQYFAEWRAGHDYHRTIESRERGGIVLVIPGFLASDTSTGPLRRAISAAGYGAHGWKLGRNWGLRPGLVERLEARVEALSRRNATPITLVGWSLGGLYAREVAKRMPDAVKRVVTLGSPFSGDIRDTRIWRMYEWVAGHSVERPPIAVRLCEKPPQPTIALWSGRDGIVAPASACGLIGEADETVEVDCTHLGFVCAPAAINAVLGALTLPIAEAANARSLTGSRRALP